ILGDGSGAGSSGHILGADPELEAPGTFWGADPELEAPGTFWGDSGRRGRRRERISAAFFERGIDLRSQGE
ncbi:MAG: hypothetical protein WCT05_09095, partial [Lentisphaeria bacterium]